MILLIDCSKGLHLVLGNKQKILVTSYKPRLKKVSEALVVEIENLLNSANINYNNLTKIIVMNGPGSFTGIRTAVTAAKVLGLSLKIPVCGISLFDLLNLHHAKNKSNKNQKFFIHLNNQKFFMQEIFKLGKKSEISIINFEIDLPIDINGFDVISSDRKIIKPLRTTSKLSQETNIFVYNDIFISCYNNLIDLVENKYNPDPIYVRTF
jgi:tRNA threonylcarbamoyl adenosine modification protein YeaZ